jgi:single-stranded DNA-specific DHH superfamily exonuclease
LSISSEVSNRIFYFYPDKYTVIAFKKGGISNLSLRGEDVRGILEKVLNSGEFEGATGGGHEKAVGARIKTEDLKKFKEMMEKEIENG